MKGQEKIQETKHNHEQENASARFFQDAYNLTSEKCREIGKASAKMAEPLTEKLHSQPPIRNYYDQLKSETKTYGQAAGTINNWLTERVKENPQDTRNAALCGLGTLASALVVGRFRAPMTFAAGMMGVVGFGTGTAAFALHPEEKQFEKSLNNWFKY